MKSIDSDLSILYKLAIVLMSMVLAAGFLAGCASTPEPVGDSMVVVEDEPEIVDDYDGDGLELPLDGSSMEAWDASLARVGRHTDPKLFKTLTDTIEYLRIYDLSARGDKEKLIKRLDGKTGYEIMGELGWRKPPPHKSIAEKGAADAEI